MAFGNVDGAACGCGCDQGKGFGAGIAAVVVCACDPSLISIGAITSVSAFICCCCCDCSEFGCVTNTVSVCGILSAVVVGLFACSTWRLPTRSSCGLHNIEQQQQQRYMRSV